MGLKPSYSLFFRFFRLLRLFGVWNCLARSNRETVSGTRIDLELRLDVRLRIQHSLRFFRLRELHYEVRIADRDGQRASDELKIFRHGQVAGVSSESAVDERLAVFRLGVGTVVQEGHDMWTAPAESSDADFHCSSLSFFAEGGEPGRDFRPGHAKTVPYHERHKVGNDSRKVVSVHHTKACQ